MEETMKENKLEDNKMEEKGTFTAKDILGRPFDDTLIYYGCEMFGDIDSFKLRNHIYKARNARVRIPRDGRYCMAEELLWELYKIDRDSGHMAGLNKNFRNVQYIRCKDQLYWVYCFNMDNLAQFKFIGYNVSYPVLERALSIAGCRMGYIHHVSEYTGAKTEVWYHPEKLVLAALSFDGEGKLIKRLCYMRKFEGKDVIKTRDTGCIFKPNTFSNVPLMAVGEYDELQSDNSRLWWTGIVSMVDDIYDDSDIEKYSWEEIDGLGDYKYAFVNPEYLEQEDFEEDSKDERFHPVYYEEMLTVMFNKGSSVH